MGGVIITTIVRYCCFIALVVNASRNLHNQMFASVSRAPVLFFDTNPIGKKLQVKEGFISFICANNYLNLNPQLPYFGSNILREYSNSLNYVGRILNRFSKDVGFLDDLLPYVFCEYLLV